MVLYTESGEFVSPIQEKDTGTFTVQASDVPLVSYRLKTRKLGPNKQPFHRKKVRLTPINERDEVDVIEEPFAVSECKEMISPISITLTSPEGESRCVSNGEVITRSDTPAVHRKSSDTQLFLDLDTFDEELENIPDIENKEQNPEVLNILAELPPRPKCKRKVLPPSITTGADNLKPKKKKLLKLRSKYENILESPKYAISKELQNVMKRQTLQVLNDQRPKSAEHGVRVITLSDLSSANSSSVPDLPSILSKIAKSNDSRDISHIPALATDLAAPSRAKSFLFEDSGALSTPRKNTDSKHEPEPKVTTEKCLKGSDIASFYNMWDRDRKTRPFDKKGSDKFKINIHRDCLCSIRNCAKKCFTQRHNVLPPISSPSRDI